MQSRSLSISQVCLGGSVSPPPPFLDVHPMERVDGNVGLNACRDAGCRSIGVDSSVAQGKATSGVNTYLSFVRRKTGMWLYGGSWIFPQRATATSPCRLKFHLS